MSIDMFDTREVITVNPEVLNVYDAEPVTRIIPIIPRRPDATGENPAYRPQTIGVVDAPLTTDQLPPVAVWSSTYVRPGARKRKPGRHRQSWRARLAQWIVGGAS